MKWSVEPTAPTVESFTDYDRRMLQVYSALIDADNRGVSWAESAADYLGLPVKSDPIASKACWRSHLDRARWIVGPGLRFVVGDD